MTVLTVAAALMMASMFVPVVARAGICAFVPCDPGPKDAVVGYTPTGDPALAVTPCASDKYSRIRILTTTDPPTVLWEARRVAPGKAQVVSLAAPPPQLEPTAPAAPSLSGEVEIDVTYPRGVARSWSSLDDLRPGRFGLFTQGGQTLSAFNAQADEGAVCVWYEPVVIRWWPAIALVIAVLLLIAALIRRRWATTRFESDVRTVFADVFG